jgi:hypothetical protein
MPWQAADMDEIVISLMGRTEMIAIRDQGSGDMSDLDQKITRFIPEFAAVDAAIPAGQSA